jgi:hypothetical protein
MRPRPYSNGNSEEADIYMTGELLHALDEENRTLRGEITSI